MPYLPLYIIFSLQTDFIVVYKTLLYKLHCCRLAIEHSVESVYTLAAVGNVDSDSVACMQVLGCLLGN